MTHYNAYGQYNQSSINLILKILTCTTEGAFAYRAISFHLNILPPPSGLKCSPDDGDSMFLQNVGIHTKDFAV
jgi:hypothetical protein